MSTNMGGALRYVFSELDASYAQVTSSIMSHSTRIPIVSVTALVDWNSQIHNAAAPRKGGEIMIAERTLSYVGKAIANALNRMASESRFDVTLRLYSGWYKGFEASVRRKAIVTASAGAPSLSTRPNVVIRPTVEFGDRLISALPTRLHRRIDIHLGDTYRRSMTDKTRFEEKMVDTAIAADLVDLAHSEPERWLLLLGEDDDLIPPLLVANGIRKQNHGRISILRKRSETPFLQFADLRICP